MEEKVPNPRPIGYILMIINLEVLKIFQSGANIPTHTATQLAKRVD